MTALHIISKEGKSGTINRFLELIDSFTFSNHFIMIRVTVDPGPLTQSNPNNSDAPHCTTMPPFLEIKEMKKRRDRT